MKKDKTLVYMGIYTKKICETLAESKNFTIMGYIVDKSASIDDQIKTKVFWEQYGVSEIALEDIPILNPTIIFLCSFCKIIKTDLLEKHLFVNIHGGILPLWRGSNANLWAMINGESVVGYSLHRVTEVLDGGPIYHVFRQAVLPNEKYGEVRERLLELVCNNIEHVFLDIISGGLLPQIQANEAYVYCNKMRSVDGIISNWDIESQILYGKYRVLGYPYGSGVHMYIHGQLYEILDMRIEPLVRCYYGVPGGVVYKTKEEVWIKTKDSLVVVGRLKKQSGEVISSGDILNIGNRL